MTNRLLDARQTAKMLGLGESTFHRHRALGLIGPQPIKLGGSVRWDALELEKWIDAACPDASAWKAIQEAASSRHASPSVLRYATKS